MTKRIRIEDCDTSGYMVLIEVWNRSADGLDVKSVEHLMSGPFDIRDYYVHRDQYLIIKEYQGGKNDPR